MLREQVVDVHSAQLSWLKLPARGSTNGVKRKLKAFGSRMNSCSDKSPVPDLLMTPNNSLHSTMSRHKNLPAPRQATYLISW